jgi:hypothetical protein
MRICNSPGTDARGSGCNREHRLWKLPDLWTRRTCAHRSLENYRTVFHELPQASFFFTKGTFLSS